MLESLLNSMLVYITLFLSIWLPVFNVCHFYFDFSGGFFWGVKYFVMFGLERCYRNKNHLIIDLKCHALNSTC